MDEIRELLTDSEQIIVLTHAHADLDSVGSAVGIAATVDATVDIATPNGVTSEAQPLLAESHVASDPDLASYDLQIVVDAPSRQRIVPLDPTANDTPLVVIDHHEPADLQSAATATCIDTDAPATALLVTDILRASDQPVPPLVAAALAAGALDDTGFRAVVMPDVQDTVLWLLEQSGERTALLSDLWQREPSWSERMAAAKAVVRTSGYKAGQTILLVSSVGGEETAAIRALLQGQADIAVVLSERGDRTRVVARRAQSLDSLSLPEDVLEPLTDEFGGSAGGHAGAGTAKLVSGRTNEIESRVIERVENVLGMQFGPFS
jgi:nanoRNase/pAp phosphatase (c-di-AMP/oligoRNAs hydrolase)